MRRPDPGLEGQGNVRSALRVGGPLLLVIGAVLTAIAFIDFFGSFGSFRQPTNFWMGFVGLPMVAIGWGMTQAGYLGAASRYVAGEVTPTLRDTIGALGLGSDVACASCGATNEAGAAFCSSCGKATAATCATCGAPNDAGSRFCNRCGAAITA